jgi:hypothetical protein
MSTYYAVISALVFAVVAVAHLIRLVNRWAVQLGPYSVPMSVSWIGLVIATDLSLGLRAISALGAACPISNVPSSFPPSTIDIDHATGGCAQRPTGTISRWYPYPLQRFRRPLFSRAIASLWTVWVLDAGLS